MTGADHTPSVDDILDAFAVEAIHSRETLERYQKSYPHCAAALLDLFFELHVDTELMVVEDTVEDIARINAAWSRHVEAGSKVSDPLAELSPTRLRDVARTLDVPKQVITAFRERRVLIDSVPRRFLARLASEVGCTLDLLVNCLTGSVQGTRALSYKADKKPVDGSPVTFERILLDAGVGADLIEVLLTEAD